MHPQVLQGFPQGNHCNINNHSSKSKFMGFLCILHHWMTVSCTIQIDLKVSALFFNQGTT